MSSAPSFLAQLKSLGSTAVDAVKGRYASGPPAGAPSAGPGSVLDQHTSQIRSMSPSADTPRSIAPSPAASSVGSGAYGSRPGEKRFDVSNMTKPLGGLSGLQRK